MDIRPIFLVLGSILVLGSFWWGSWAIWLGAPLVFLSIIFQYIDRD